MLRQSATSPKNGSVYYNYNFDGTVATKTDAYGRPSSTTSPYGAVTNVSYSVSPPYKLVTTKTRYSKSYLDGFGRSIKDETGYTATTGGTTTYTPVSVTETQYAPCGCTPMGKTKQVSIPRTPGATAYWTVYNYDALGRTTSVVQPNNSGTTTYAYTGNKVTVTDPAGAWKSFYTDAMGNLTQVTEPNPAGGNFDTFYTYTVLNQLTTVSMTRPAVPGPGGTVTQTRTFNYNGGVLLQSATNPENGTVSYTYNADGTVATKTDAKGQTLTYVYDSMARLIQVKNGAVVLRTLTYDDNSGYGQNLIGRLARVDYGAGNNRWAELYSYHSAGAVLKKNLVMTRSGYKPANLEASWTYDDEGQVTAIKYPDYNAGGNPATGPTYTYSFDHMSRPLGLSDGTSPNNIASGATYGPAGQLTALNYGGIGESRSCNILNQLTAINSTAGTISYTYSATNNDGCITRMSSTISGESVTYAYDSLKRLITASAGSQWGLSFSYDGFGNRLSQNVTAGTAPTIQQSYDMQTNRLLGQGYDNNGNMTSMGTFDAENRLVNTGTDTYDYGIDNKRIYKTVTGTINTEEVYFYAGGRIATYQTSYGSPDASGSIPVSFVQPVYNVYFGGKLIISGGQTVITDRLGSVVARLQTAYNQTFEKHSYFPYGEERTASTNNRDKFGAYFRDASTGFDYADQRFYRSSIGRFLSVDRYQASGGANNPNSWNRFSFVQSDPVNFADKTGNNRSTTDDQAFCGANWMSVPWEQGPCTGAGGGGGDEPPDFCEEAYGNSLAASSVTCMGRDGLEEEDGQVSGWQACPAGQSGIRYCDVSRVGTAWKSLAKDIKKVGRLLRKDAKCLSWLSGAKYVDTKNLSRLFAIASSFELPENIQSAIPSGMSIGATANDYQAMQNNGVYIEVNNAQYSAMDKSARRALIIHELAHYYSVPGFGNDVFPGNPKKTTAAEAANNKAVNDNCFVTLNAK